MFGSLYPFNSELPFNSNEALAVVQFMDALMPWLWELTGETIYLGYVPQSVKNDDAVLLQVVGKKFLNQLDGSSMGGRITSVTISSRSTTLNSAYTLDRLIALAIDRQSGIHSGHNIAGIQFKTRTSSSEFVQNAWRFTCSSNYEIFHYDLGVA